MGVVVKEELPDKEVIEHYTDIQNAVLGEEIEAFFNSNMGKYLLAEATRIETNSKNKLATFNPNDVEGIKQLQAEIAACTTALKWLVFKMQEGKQILQNIQEMERGNK